MIKTYKLAKSWRYLSIFPAAMLFVGIWALYIFGGGSVDMPIGAWMFLIIVNGFAGWIIYSTMISKIVTSLEGIEYISFGIRGWAAWDTVEKIEFTPDGFVKLHFKEPI